MIVHFRLLFSPQDSQPLSPALEEEALRHGLAAALHKQGFSLAAYGTISSASLTGMALLPLPGRQSRCPVLGLLAPKVTQLSPHLSQPNCCRALALAVQSKLCAQQQC